MVSDNSQKYYIWLFLILIAIILLSPLPYWLTGIGQSAHKLSAEIERAPDGALISSPKAEARHSLTLPMRIERIIIYPLLLLSFQLSGTSLALRRWLEPRLQNLDEKWAVRARRWSGWKLLRWLSPLWRWLGRLIPDAWRQRLNRGDLLVILLFILIFHLGLFLLYLPFNFYRGFIVAHQFGLSAQTAPGWFNDWLKSVLIALITNGLLWTGFFALIRLFPRRWPIPGGAMLLLFNIIFILLAPVLITPLFYEVSPLDDTVLRDRILNLADRAGMAVDNVYVIDASAKTTAANAYVAGIGDGQRIVLFDTLFSGYTPDQIEVVLAHEMGHWYFRHVWWSTLGLSAIGWLGLFGLRWLLNRTWRLLGLRRPGDVAALPFILAVVFIASMLSLPMQTAISRYGEGQADQFALTVSQKPRAFVTLFLQFAEQNLSLVEAPVWEEFIFHTHPSIAQRIRMAERFQETAANRGHDRTTLPAPEPFLSD